MISDDTAKGSKPMGEPTDQELFESATANEPVQEAPAEPEAQTEAAPAANRDEQGRFAPHEAVEAKAEEPAPAVEQPERQDGRVPSGLLREEKEARRRLEAEIAELRGQVKAFQQVQPPAVQPKEPEQPASMWDDPDKWAGALVKSSLDPISQQMTSVVQTWSKRFAEKEHGAEKVSQAYAALEQAVGSGAMNGDVVKDQLNKSVDPFGDIIAWYDRTERDRDPAAYERKIIEKFLASQSQQPAPAAQPQAPGSVVRLPPSLNRATSAASSNGAGADDVSDAALFSQTTARRR